MIPNNYMLEQLNIQHRQQLMQKAEHKHILSRADSQQRASRQLSHMAGRLGIVLLKLGTTLQELEQHSQVVATSSKSR